MTFEERLRDLVDTLADRLRHEAAGHFQEGMVDLHELMKAERTAAVSEAVRAARETVERESADRLTVAVVDATRGAREAAERETIERVTAAVTEAEARSYEAGRADGRTEGKAEGREQRKEEGRTEGFAAGREAGVAEGREQARAEGRHAQSAAIERLAAATRLIDESRSLSEILDALADAARREAGSAALFLTRGDELRSWRLSGFGRALDEAARFDIPLSDAGLLAEAIRDRETVSADSADEASVPGFVSLRAGRQILAVPVCLSGEVVAVLYGDQGENAEPRPAWTAALEMLVRHAARALEAVTAFRAAKLLSGSVPMGESTPHGDGDAAEDAGGAQAARRYARLLISEIKLDHESAVLAGRRERDLATRLGGEIARARVLYEQRVAPQVRRTADHFHAELVSTLANGDASLLGNPELEIGN